MASEPHESSTLREPILACAHDFDPTSELRCHAALGLLETCETLSMALRRVLADFALTEKGFRLLAVLAHGTPHLPTAGQLAREVGLHEETVEAALGRLEVSGLVRYQTDANAGANRVQMTPEGGRLFGLALMGYVAALSRLMADFDDGELACLERLSARLRQLSLDALRRTTRN